MLQIEHITKHFERNPALRGVSLTVEAGEIVCLLGPSGCGKSTLLRIVAGLEQPDSGHLLLNGQDITRQPPHLRGFGLMFQDFALFPHLSVAGNIAFGLRMAGIGQAEQQARIQEVLALVRLTGFEKRGVSQLSGGEQQRVALARSLAPRPRLLMLDEPLGSLDAALREALSIELRDIIKAAGLTALYVTHDQREAFAVADRIVLMQAGAFEQIDAPQALYLRPRSEFAARFLGLDNIIPIKNIADGVAHTDLGTFPLMGEAAALLLHPAFGELTLAENGIPVRVEKSLFRGALLELDLRHASGIRLHLSVPIRGAGLPQVGEEIGLRFAQEGILALPARPEHVSL